MMALVEMTTNEELKKLEFSDKVLNYAEDNEQNQTFSNNKTDNTMLSKYPKISKKKKVKTGSDLHHHLTSWPKYENTHSDHKSSDVTDLNFNLK